MIRPVAAVALAGILAACATLPGSDPPDPAIGQPEPGRCDAARGQRLIGRAATPSLIETARRATGAATVRTIMPGSMVTMDYRPDRLGITVDERNRVTAIRCG